MAKVLTDPANYSAIANAIRAKGIEGAWKPDEMAEAIASIGSTGGKSFEYDNYALITPHNAYQLDVSPYVSSFDEIKGLIAMVSFTGSTTALNDVSGFFFHCPSMLTVTAKSPWADTSRLYYPIAGYMSDRTYRTWSVQLPIMKDELMIARSSVANGGFVIYYETTKNMVRYTDVKSFGQVTNATLKDDEASSQINSNLSQSKWYFANYPALLYY